MFRLHGASLAILILALFADLAAAQSAPSITPTRLITAESAPAMSNLAQASAGTRRDSVWNGALIGLGAGIGAAAALDAMFCDNGFGGCDTPWAAYVTLGMIGASAGAGIDFLIGRNRTAGAPWAGKATVRLAPLVGRSRQGLRASIRF